MNRTFAAERPKGYFQVAAGGVDAVQTMAQLIAAAGNRPDGTPYSLEGVSLILITPEAQAVRWRDDGGIPTASVGYPLPVGSELAFTPSSSSQLRFISQAAGAILNVVLYSNG